MNAQIENERLCTRHKYPDMRVRCEFTRGKPMIPGYVSFSNRRTFTPCRPWKLNFSVKGRKPPRQSKYSFNPDMWDVSRRIYDEVQVDLLVLPVGRLHKYSVNERKKSKSISHRASPPCEIFVLTAQVVVYLIIFKWQYAASCVLLEHR